MPELLPDSRAKSIKHSKLYRGINWIPLYCANCGGDGGWVPEADCTFAFYLCDNCEAGWKELPGTYTEPDTVFWARLKNEQMEKYGRELEPHEIIEVLKDDTSTISKLARDRKDFNKIKMT